MLEFAGRPVGSCEEDDIIEPELGFKGMRKLTPSQQKKFPNIVADSMACQSYYIARCEKCKGCDCAIEGCEKVVYMPAG